LKPSIGLEKETEIVLVADIDFIIEPGGEVVPSSFEEMRVTATN
jgi:hypothetical protein